MNILLVVAHPDDEVLGAGGTMYKMASKGNNIDICIMSGNVNARVKRPDDESLLSDIDKSCEYLKVRNKMMFDFPNIQFNLVPHIELVQAIEKCIIEYAPDVVITHHPNDLNNDHFHTSTACQEAIRLFQRRCDVKPITSFMYMEVLSSTEWALNKAGNAFEPDTFIELEEDALHKKIEALSCYRDVMRPYPHPRSVEALKGLAAYRGAQSGLMFAEAFQSVFRRNKL